MNARPRASTIVLVVAVLVCLLFGLWGWSMQGGALGLSPGDVFYRSLSALWLSDLFQSGAHWGHDPRVEIARWAGLIAFAIGATKTLIALLSDRWETLRARRRRGHAVVIGHAPLATSLVHGALERGLVVHWLSPSAEAIDAAHRRLYCANEPFTVPGALELGLVHATWVAIAVDEDARALAMARRIRQVLPGSERPALLASVRSPWLALHVDTLEGTDGIALFSEAQMAVRRLQRRHPPFLIARTLGHARLHSVIVGFGAYGEAVLIETLLSSLTSELACPLFTIVDPEADRVSQHLALRYPELEESAEIRVVAGAIEGAGANVAPSSLHAIGEVAPVSSYHVCLSDEDRALSVALALRALAQRERRSEGPIHVRLSNAGTLPSPPPGASRLEAGHLVPFGLLDQLLLETGLFDTDTDHLARQFHEAYRRVAAPEKRANVPWADLPEDLRDSNRRLVAHIPAKLSSAGIDVEAWLAGATGDVPDTWPTIDAEPDAATLEALAVLEHERWMADRRINGWQHGAERADGRRRHPDLVPFERLSADSQSYDRTMVATLVKALRDAPTSEGQ